MFEKIKAYILVQHEVSDFELWKKIFEKNDPRWETAGMRLMHLFHSADNENEVTMIFEVDDLIMMQVHLQSGAVFSRMIEAGMIVGDVKFDILEKVK
jgi:hypothetical protein